MTDAFRQVADDDGLMLYTDWASPTMYDTLASNFQDLLAGRISAQDMAKNVQDDWDEVRRDAEAVEIRWTETAAQVGSETAARDRARARKRAPGEPRNVAWLYILPGLLFYGLFTLAPLAHTVELSFFDWDGLTVGHYIGLANYREAFSDPLVRDSFKHSAELIVFYALLPVALGLLLTAHPDPPSGARLHVLPHRPLPAADDRGRGRGAGVGVDLRRQRAAERVPARHRPRLAGAAVAGRLHAGRCRRSAGSGRG